MLGYDHHYKNNKIFRTNDGSLSDSNYATYGEPQSRSPYTWLHPASTYSTSVTNPDQPYAPGCQDIAGSNESLNSVTSSIQVPTFQKRYLLQLFLFVCLLYKSFLQFTSISFLVKSISASTSEQFDKGPADDAPATASPWPGDAATSGADVRQPLGEELRILDRGLHRQSRERVLRYSLPGATQRFAVQVATDVTVEEHEHRGGVIAWARGKCCGRGELSLRLSLRRSRFESLSSEHGFSSRQANGCRDSEVEKGVGRGA